MTKYVYTIVMLFIFIAIFNTCDQNPFHPEKDSQLLSNKPPDTFLFLFSPSDSIGSDSMQIRRIDTTASRQLLHWWGQDSDGEVIGYYYQWDYQKEPVWTTSEYDTFYVPIRSSYDEFTFKVWAVDNDSLIDPTPAIQIFPIYNTFPEISFKINSNPIMMGEDPNVVNKTFPTRTFFWDIYDADGTETIMAILWALDDTTNWNIIERNGDILPDHVTVIDISEGYHTFFAKAVDIAGAQSNIIFYPDSTDDQVPNKWYVSEPNGKVLLVDDYATGQTDGTAQLFYSEIIQNIVGDHSIWEIGNKSTWNPINPHNALPYSTLDVEANLNYFKNVIWFSHLGPPNIGEAGLALTKYVKNGGQILIANGNETYPDTNWTFTDIDSAYRINPAPIRLLNGIKINAFLGDEKLNEQLGLEIGSENIYFNTISNKVSGIIPGPNVEVIYRLENGDSTGIPQGQIYAGEPIVGIKYNPDFISGKCIYYSLPLHACDNKRNVKDLIEYILTAEFD